MSIHEARLDSLRDKLEESVEVPIVVTKAEKREAKKEKVVASKKEVK